MSWEKLQQILPQVEKPARYIGNEMNSIVKDEAEVEFRFALAFPDVYEIGSSYLGFQILYDLLNRCPGVQAERVFAPWPDMEAKMRANGLALYGLESKLSLRTFDIIGFTLQYELCYTNVLNMLDLAGLSPYAAQRAGGPLVIAGGPGALNPEPMTPFIDAFVIGEGEEVVMDILAVVQKAKGSGLGRKEVLQQLAAVEGVYVPEFYRPRYQKGHYTGTVAVAPVPYPVKKRIVRDFAALPLPEKIVVPLVQPVHDRVSIEIFRGCARGCRFCQAGMAYRPVRERPVENLLEQGRRLLACTGSAELSLSSLSSADYSQIKALAKGFSQDRISVSLPSLRVDSYSVDLAKLTGARGKTGLTLAPEAGTQRLRDVINKNVSAGDILGAVKTAFANGWDTIKLYFMIGLPTETREDVAGIAALAEAIADLYRQVRGNSRRLQLNLGVSTFVPKPHTPFQWHGRLDREEVVARQQLLRDRLSHRRYKVQVTRWEESALEGALARGDRQLGQVIARAWQLGCKFDAWSEHFRFDLWQQAFAEAGLDIEDYSRPLPLEQPLPWDHIDIGVSKDFLRKEAQRALAGQRTPDCTLARCSACGICAAYNVKPFKREGGKFATGD